MENDQKQPRKSMAEVLGEALRSGSLEADPPRGAPDDFDFSNADVAEVLKNHDLSAEAVRKGIVEPLD